VDDGPGLGGAPASTKGLEVARTSSLNMGTMYSDVLKDAKFSDLDVGGGGFNFRGGGRGGGDGGGGGGGGDGDDKNNRGPLLPVLLAAPFILHLIACLVLFVRFVPRCTMPASSTP